MFQSNPAFRSGFAVVYQTYIKPDQMEAYKTAWHKVASYFKERRGALGSCLQQMEDGRIVAYSRWPNKETRDKSWPGESAPSTELPDEVREAIMIMKRSADDDRNEEMKVVYEMCLNVVDDLLLPQTPTNPNLKVSSPDVLEIVPQHVPTQGMLLAYNSNMGTGKNKNRDTGKSDLKDYDAERKRVKSRPSYDDPIEGSCTYFRGKYGSHQ